MSSFELSLIIKKLSKQRTIDTVHRIGSAIISEGGFIEKIEFMGSTNLPYRISANKAVHNQGSYFMMLCHAPYDSRQGIREVCRRDMDVIRGNIFYPYPVDDSPCQLHQEAKPPSLRPEVIKMAEEAKERSAIKDRLKPKEHLEYNPFG